MIEFESKKDPVAILDYLVDWAPWLQAGETLATVEVAVPAGITLLSNPAPAIVTGNKIVWWLSGGTAENAYEMTITITTDQGRKDRRTALVEVAKR